MQRKPLFAFLGIALVLTLAAVPTTAAKPDPILEFLEGMVQPVLNSIQTGVAAGNRTLDAIQIQGSTVLSEIQEVKSILDGSPTVITFSTTLMTHPNNGGEVVNLDVAAGVNDLLDPKIRRYTITVHTGGLAQAPASKDAVGIFSAVLKGSSAEQVMISSTDPSGRQSLAIVERPFAGTNTFIRVDRGADGLGDVEIHVSGYIELAP